MTLHRKGDERQALSRKRVLEAAIPIIEAEGLAALSMRRLGRELGVEAMSLYEHVGSKDDLLDGMIELAAASMELTVMDAGPPWQVRLRAGMREYRRLGHRYPVLFALIGHRPVRAVRVLRPLDAALAVLADAGFAPDRALVALRLLNSFTYGFTLSEITGLAIEGASERPAGDAELEEMPHLAAALRTLPSLDFDAGFERGLDFLIAGLEVDIAPSAAS